MAIFFTMLKMFMGFWWLWLPPFLIALFIELWVKYLKEEAIKKIRWILLEVRIPRTIEKTPKAMELIFSGLHGIATSVKFLDKYWKGKVQEWFSLEIAGIDGAVYFFIRTPEENIFIQYLIQPVDKEYDKKWRAKGAEIINKLSGKKVEVKKGLLAELFSGLGEFLVNLFMAVAVYPEWGEAKKEESKSSASLSSTDKVVVEAIDNKISKLAFKTCIRFAYIAKKDSFKKAIISAVRGALKQFNSVNLNGFKGNGRAGTTADQPRIVPFIKTRREFLRKLAFVDRYINRKMSKNKKDFILNIEELATIYHYPILVVETPTMRRVGAKTAEPPISLPI